MKISLCLIVKNEEATLSKLLASIIDYVDEVVCTDTGSTDKTKEVAEKYCGDKLKWSTFEWCDDFSAARNYNFSQATGDWLLWADADDMIVNAKELCAIIKDCEKGKVNAVTFPYHYVIDEDGNTTALQMRERLIKNDGTYKWIGKLHEAMIPQNKMAMASALDTVHWVHCSSPERVEKSTARNLEILKKAFEEELKSDKVDPRTLYNLGNAYFTVNKYDKAIECYVNYIPMSGWSEEIYLARHRIALAMMNLGKFDIAIEAAMKAIMEKPEYPDAYVDLGKIYFNLQDYTKAIYWFKQVLTKEVPKNLPVYNPMDYTANIYWLLGTALIQDSRFREAKNYFIKFSQFHPKNEDVATVLEAIDDAEKEAEMVKAITEVGKIMNKEGKDQFWSLLPEKYMVYPEILFTKNQVVKKTTSSGKDMAIYCGNCIVEWDPSSETTGGIGGSEEAVINIARLLAKKGWNITVFGRPIAVGNFDGVEYKNYLDFNPRDKYDVAISWRMPAVFRAPINATKKYVWLHDCTPEAAFSPEVLANIDGIIVLSLAHRALFPNIPGDKFIFSANGINPDHFKTPVKRNPFYCINTSAPDRGLDTLLKIWPKIKEAVPKAELHWFYGWEVYDKLHKDNPEKMAYKKYIQSQMLTLPGVFEEGRVDHVTVAKKYQEAQLWLYPTEFYEIYCITSDKAIAGGALPVVTNVGAVGERVHCGSVIESQEIYSDMKAQEDYTNAVIHYLKNPVEVTKLRAKMERASPPESFAWQKVADQWDKFMLCQNSEFSEGVGEKVTSREILSI